MDKIDRSGTLKVLCNLYDYDLCNLIRFAKTSWIVNYFNRTNTVKIRCHKIRDFYAILRELSNINNKLLFLTVQSFCVRGSLGYRTGVLARAEKNSLTLYKQLSFLMYTTVALTVT